MAANPITDQYAQAIRDQQADNIKTAGLSHLGTQELDESIAAIAEALREQLPNLDPAIVGGVTLHAVAAVNELYMQGIERGDRVLGAVNAAINLIALAAVRLYSPEPVGDLPPVDGGEPR